MYLPILFVNWPLGFTLDLQASTGRLTGDKKQENSHETGTFLAKMLQHTSQMFGCHILLRNFTVGGE